MKKRYILLTIIAILAIFMTSCEKRCICYDKYGNSADVTYNSYFNITTKKECTNYADILEEELQDHSPIEYEYECYYENH